VILVPASGSSGGFSNGGKGRGGSGGGSSRDSGYSVAAPAAADQQRRLG